MAADKVLTDLAKRYIATLPPVKGKKTFVFIIFIFSRRALLNYQKIMFVHH
jgi:hypothetical protein